MSKKIVTRKSAIHGNGMFAVASIKKGERLILVTDHAGAESTRLTEWARENGAPELAVPKKIIRVPEVPVLGTGKTDYVAITRMAEAEVRRAA